MNVPTEAAPLGASAARVVRRQARPRGAVVVVWVLWLASAVSVGISIVSPQSSGDLVGALAQGVAALSFATCGAVLASRLPANPIGWLLALGGISFALIGGANGLANAGLSGNPGSIPGAIWFAWLTQWIWAPAIGAVIGLGLVYPTGRLLSARWRPVGLARVLIFGLISFGSAVTPWPDGLYPARNPLELGGGALVILHDIVAPAVLIALLVAFLAVASLLIRYRRGAGVERAQLKWFAALAAICLPTLFVGLTLW